MKRIFAVLLIVGVLLSLCACDGLVVSIKPGEDPQPTGTNKPTKPQATEPTEEPTEPAPVVYTRADLTFEDDGNGYDYTFLVSDDAYPIYNGNIPAEQVTFTSSDESVASIGADGSVAALRAGFATLSAKYGEWEIFAVVRCVYSETDLRFVDLGDGYNYTFEVENVLYKIYSGTIPAEYVTFKSSDETVVTVTAEGAVRSLSEGTAIITAEYESWKIEATVSCVPKTVIYTEADLTFKDVGYGYEYTVPYSWRTYSLYNGRIPTEKVTFTSNDRSVATVDSKGVVTFVGTGRVIITAKYGEWEIEAIIHVTN